MARRDLSNPLSASVFDGPKNGNGKKMKTLPAKEIKSKGPKSLVLRDGGKRKVEHGSWDFGIDGKSVEVEGKMITRKSGKKRFRADKAEDRKMFRKIKSNKRKAARKGNEDVSKWTDKQWKKYKGSKAHRKFLKEQHEEPLHKKKKN